MSDVLMTEHVWVPRTALDMRIGDLVRLPSAPDLHALVVFAQSLRWNVRPGGHGHRSRFADAPLTHVMVHARLDYPGVRLDDEGRPALLELPGETPIEIRMAQNELAALETLAWAMREKVG